MLEKSVGTHYILGRTYALNNETHYLDYSFKRLVGHGKYRKKNKHYANPVNEDVTRAFNQSYQSFMETADRQNVYIDYYALPKLYNSKRLCYSVTDNEIRYEYIPFHNRFTFRQKCKELHPKKSMNETNYIKAQYEKLNKNLTDLPISIHKIIPLGKLFSDLNENQNFSVIPMNAFGRHPTLDQWSQQLHSTYANTIHKEKVKIAPRKPREIRDEPIDLKYLNDQVAYGEEKIHLSIKAQLNKNFHYLKGYECNRPVQIQDTSSLIKHYCPDQNPTHVIPDQKIRGFQLLQKEELQRVKGYHCTIIESRLHLFCGAFDHMAIDPGRTVFEIPMPVTPEECKQLALTKTYRAPNGKLHAIALNTDNVITFLRSGEVYYESGELQCVGQSILLNHIQMTDIVSSSQLKIRIQEEEFVIDQSNRITANFAQKKLPCSAKKGSCVISPDTFFWERETDYCPLAVSKEFKGIEVSGDGTTVIMSADNSLIRLIKGPSITYCGRIVYSTNYKSLYLLPLIDPDTKQTIPEEQMFSRRVHPNENNIHTFVANRDDYLFNHIRNKLNDEFRKVIGQDCHRRLAEAKLDHWVLRSTPGYYSYSRGQGNFAITAGEVVYTYTCSPVIVKALSLKQCFTNLPVVIAVKNNQETKEASMNDDEIPKNQIRYLEPITRRLFSTGAPIPCSDTFVPKYLTVRNNWIEQSPVIRLAGRPDHNTIYANNHTFSNIVGNIDFSKGGIISEDEMKNLQRYMEFGRVRDAISMTMANQIANFDGSEPITPFMAFPPDTLPGGSWYTLILGPIMGFLRQLGDWTSIAIAIFVIGRLLVAFISLCFSCCSLYHVHGWSKQLFWIPFSEMLHTKEYIKKYNHVRKDRLKNKVGIKKKYQQWKKDRKRRQKRRDSSESDGIGETPFGSRTTRNQNSDTCSLPRYMSANQLHQPNVESVRPRTTRLYSPLLRGEGPVHFSNLTESDVSKTQKNTTIPTQPQPNTLKRTSAYIDPAYDPTYAQVHYSALGDTIRLERSIPPDTEQDLIPERPNEARATFTDSEPPSLTSDNPHSKYSPNA